jgi:hypothetical protein
MGIEDPAPIIAPAGSEAAAPARPATPSWADEATVAVPLTDLFTDDREE